MRACVCVRARVCVCVSARARACVCVCADVCVVCAVLIKVHTVYVDMDGIERSDICSDLKYTSFSYSILDNVDVVKSWSFGCRKADFTSRNLPFGHQITITMDNSPANVTLDVHEVIVYGRPYTGQDAFCVCVKLQTFALSLSLSFLE